MRVLIAEDGKFARKLLAVAVDDLGHDSLVVEDGDAAWEALRSERFDVLVTDWEMPGLTGIELCQRVREAGLDSYLYIILLTARSARDDRLQALAAGVDDFLTKPFDRAELGARLAVAGRILQWASQLEAVNDMLMDSARQLAEKTAELDDLRTEAEYMANHDSLTGLLNRRAWLARMGEAGHLTAVAMADIDHFKRVNDTYGHPAGDSVLRAVAARLGEGPGVVARFGGEEFAIGFTCSEVEALEWCERVLGDIGSMGVETTHGPLGVTISIGLSPAAGDLDGALRAADAALYDAKHGGRNQVSRRSHVLA